ncbi:MAG: heat-inducible transcription repressor HrcA [Firmicutes bacterium]|nr:heat-inducible transcription repressor HrcA [Candidatus Colimorpha enterica]
MRSSGLNDRKKMILKAIVEAYVRDGGPVGSKYLTQNNKITLSSATIRNEMAELEEMGYLEQPHTSAGRIPSESGYRLYVDSLMQRHDMTESELARMSTIAKAKMAEIDKLLDAASKLCAAMTIYSSLSIRSSVGAGTFDSFRLVLLADGSLMLIAISGGNVNTKQLMIGTPVSADTVQRFEALLNEKVAGLTADEISMPIVMDMERELGGEDELVHTVIKAICSMNASSDREDMKLSGVNHLLEYPEYSDVNKFKDLLSVLEDKRDILKLIDDVSDREDAAQVIIGSESAVEEMKDSSIVLKKIKRGGKVIGAIGVLGPRRMDYSKVISTVDCIADNLEEVLSRQLLEDGF